MPYALKLDASVTRAIITDSINLDSTTGDSWRIEMLVRGGNWSGGVGFFRGSASSPTRMEKLSTDRFRIRTKFASGNDNNETSAVTLSYSTDEDYLIGISSTPTELAVFRDDNFQVLRTGAGRTFDLDILGDGATSGTNFTGLIYEAKVYQNEVVTNHWLNTTGTGNVWTDIVGGNDAVLEGAIPTDDSQWVFYGEPAGDDVDSTLAAAWPMFSVNANQSTVSAGVNSSIASTWPLFSVSAAQDSAVPAYDSTVAATWPMFDVSAQQAATVPVYVSTAAMQWPMFTVQASQGAESPAIDSTIAAQWPMFTASASQASVAPQYTSNAAITWPMFTVAASQAQELPAGATTVAVTWPMLTVSGSQASTVPAFTASVDSTWPMFTVQAEQAQSFAGAGAVVDVTWPMFSVSGSQSATVPEYSLTASATWPMFSVQAFAGEFEYFTAPDARIDLPRLSRRVDISGLSRRIDL